MLLSIFIAALVVSLLVCIALIRTQHLHARLSMDNSSGVQKFHVNPTPRIGGVPLFLGVLLAALVSQLAHDHVGKLFGNLLLASIPVFLAGLTEDMTKRVSPLWRLLAAFTSAGLAAWLSGCILPKLGIIGVDYLLQIFPAVAVLFTVFAVGGVCHSINIIDGYNGLMGGVVLSVTGALAYVSLAVGDLPLLAVCLALAGGILGFLVWNFPKGMIFAGDAGAYLAGFMLAELAVLLVARHPGVVSPWFPFLVLIYPVFETIFSIWRKKFLRKMSPGLPDGLHFHMLVYKRLVRWMVGSREVSHLTRRNSLTAPYLWGVALFSITPALLLWKVEWALQVSAILFVIGYVWVYRRLVTFRAPRALVLRKNLSNVKLGRGVYRK
ncbi:UDP-N-acetylmuramyl pentapeptide phosphotransferase/UDP-N-acetylglucosamine-1-phosphate transferase [Vogesella sp. LIG4]|nr:UDP-N-acetylmuramyl pentapeptide phosphotransferase/UDP-N-acetylglucosamine-1-phosphate transferase [Vogesella sp. LIG4]